ncbi:MAG: hypothetical protein RLZZ184_97 [Cyanobacteriota bacterium]|jgi:hypothetical protein
MNLPKISRKEAGHRLGVGERQIQRYLKVAVQYLSSFSSFIDPVTSQLNGSPLTDKEVNYLKEVQALLRKYKNFKGKEKMIESGLKQINQGDSNV